MSPYGYVQLFLLGLFCTGAFSEENATCTSPRPQSNIDMNKLYGDWFVGMVHAPSDITEFPSQCYTESLKKINETTFEIIATGPQETSRRAFTIENTENAGTWQAVDKTRTVEVIYLSADGTAMAMSSCLPNLSEPIWILLSKQIPVSSEKTQEFLLAAEHAGLSESNRQISWESKAACPST